MLFSCRLPIPPVVKKNSKNIWKNKKTGKYFLGNNKVYDYWTPGALLALQSKKIHSNNRLKFPITTLCHVKFAFAGIWDFRDKNIPDLSNLYEAPQDWLQKARIIDDDRLIASHDQSRRIELCEWCDFYVDGVRRKTTKTLKRCPGARKCLKAYIDIQIYEFNDLPSPIR